jgi:WhiB family redox-sensing transcriptional regulator
MLENIKLDFPEFLKDDNALCAEVDPELFFPTDEHGVGNSYTSMKEAKKICNACTLKLQCLEYALRRNESGIWGGTTEGERRKIRNSGRTLKVGRPAKLK